jgi:molecular chaperone DnaK
MSDTSDNLKGKLILGIDLGTTKSGISVWDERQGRVVMLPDAHGRCIIPSVVAWDRQGHQWLVGHAARTLAEQQPHDVVYSIKRYIGRWFDDPHVARSRQRLTYRLDSGGGKDKLRDVVADLGTDQGHTLRLSAPEVSAKVLRQLRETAAQALSLPLEEVRYAVITVPAYFGMLQRQATILAGTIAGLEVVDILNEPTAAALAHSDSVLSHVERRILVCDLGGGTFDVSLLEASRDEAGYVFFTRVVDGDTRLGGDDIDASVVDWLVQTIEKQCGHTVRPDDVSRARLRFAAEQAKIALSSQETCTVELSRFETGGGTGALDIRLDMTRSELKDCASEVLRRTQEITRRAVKNVAGLTWDQIDETILVGGQTLTPAVQRIFAELTGREPRISERPQHVVALGAGEYAHILSLGREKFQENALVDVLALPVGIRLDDNTFRPTVEANVTVPHRSRPIAVTTTEDNQPSIHVEILQGRPGTEDADQCVLLDSIDMEVPPAPARTPRFEVVFDVRKDGTMTVTLTDTRRQRTASKEIMETNLEWRDMRPEETSGPKVAR